MTTPSLFSTRDPRLCSFCTEPWTGIAFQPHHPLGPQVKFCAEHRSRPWCCRDATGLETCPRVEYAAAEAVRAREVLLG